MCLFVYFYRRGYHSAPRLIINGSGKGGLCCATVYGKTVVFQLEAYIGRFIEFPLNCLAKMYMNLEGPDLLRFKQISERHGQASFYRAMRDQINEV